jgi:LysR family transcriptional regulator for bpeEF and oprC
MVSKLPAFFAAYPDMAVEMAASESPTTIIEDGFDLAIHSGEVSSSPPFFLKELHIFN